MYVDAGCRPRAPRNALDERLLRRLLQFRRLHDDYAKFVDANTSSTQDGAAGLALRL